MTSTPKKKRGRPARERPGRKAAAETPVDPSATLIKKYGNRRLYDTRRSRYVTLEEVQDVIARGEEVVVVDETTGEDVTKRVMTQIILQEEESRHLNLLPLNFLKKLIQYRDETLTDYFQKYLSASLDAFMGAQRAMEQRLPGAPPWDGQSPPFPGMPSLGALGSMMPWLPVTAPWMGGGTPAPGTPPAPPANAAPQQSAAPPPAAGLSDEVAELRRRLADLETRYRK